MARASIHIWMLAALMAVGLGLPRAARVCAGPARCSIAGSMHIDFCSPQDAEHHDAQGCCCCAPASDAPEPCDHDGERTPGSGCPDDCRCPGACCLIAKVVACDRIVRVEMPGPIPNDHARPGSVRLDARDPNMSLLRPPRA